MRNARFWVWHNGGWVKLTLKPEQALSTDIGGRTDEGWYREMTRYTHDGAGVIAEYVEEGSDCDGRLDRGGEMYCPLNRLSDRDMCGINPCSENLGIWAPEWERKSRWQQDYTAEANGY